MKLREFTFYICKGRNSLHFCLLRVHSPEFSLITSVYQILQYSATRLMYIIRSPYYNYTLGTKQLGCYHIIHWFSFKLGYKYILSCEKKERKRGELWVEVLRNIEK